MNSPKKILALTIAMLCAQAPARTWINTVATSPKSDYCVSSSPLDSLRELDVSGALVRKVTLLSDGDFSPICAVPYLGIVLLPSADIAQSDWVLPNAITDIAFLGSDSTEADLWAFTSSPSDTFDVATFNGSTANTAEHWGAVVLKIGGWTSEYHYPFSPVTILYGDNLLAKAQDSGYYFAGGSLSLCYNSLLEQDACGGPMVAFDLHKPITALGVDARGRRWVGVGDSVFSAPENDAVWTSHYLGWTPREVVTRDSDWVEVWSSNIRKDGIVHPRHIATWKQGVWSQSDLDTNGPSKIHCPRAGSCFVAHQTLTEHKATIYREKQGVAVDSFFINRWVLDMAIGKYGELYVGTDSGMFRIDTLTRIVYGPEAFIDNPLPILQGARKPFSGLRVRRQSDSWQVQCPAAGRLEQWSLQGRLLGSVPVTAGSTHVPIVGDRTVLFRWVGAQGQVQSTLGIGW